jgi:hypothetical protein
MRLYRGGIAGQPVRNVLLAGSCISLALGFACYWFLRDPVLAVNDVLGIPFADTVVISGNAVIDVIRYNVVDGLWLLSGILALRWCWFYSPRIGAVYVAVFTGLGIAFECLQYTGMVPGTFDIMDLGVMALFAVGERALYQFYVTEEDDGTERKNGATYRGSGRNICFRGIGTWQHWAKGGQSRRSGQTQ